MWNKKKYNEWNKTLNESAQQQKRAERGKNQWLETKYNYFWIGRKREDRWKSQKLIKQNR